jgi:hypothetical protein
MRHTVTDHNAEGFWKYIAFFLLKNRLCPTHFQKKMGRAPALAPQASNRGRSFSSKKSTDRFYEGNIFYLQMFIEIKR